VKRQMLRQMQKKMQDSLGKIQEELASEEVEGSAGGGVVKIRMSGSQEVRSIKIDPSIVNPEEVDMLEDLIMLAIRDAMTKSQELGASKMTQLAGGLNLPPGLF